MRWIVRAGLVLVVLVALGFGLLAMIPSERVAALLALQFETMTGRKMELSGDISPRIWPNLGVTTGPVSIANADWSKSEDPLFQAESLSVDINLGALMGGEVKIEGVKAATPVFNLERSKDGKDNWDFGAGEAGGAGSVPNAATAFTLAEGTIEGGSIRFVDHGADREIALDDVNASLEVPDYSGPFTLTGKALSGGQPVSLDLAGDVFSAFTGGRVVPLTVKLIAGGSTIAFDGRGGFAPLAAEGVLAADLSDLPALGRLWGSELSQPSLGMGKDKLTVAGQVTLDGSGAAYLRGAEVDADSNHISGDFDLVPGEARPTLKGQLVAGPLVIGSEGGGSGESAASKGWSAAEIDVSALGLADAEIGFSAPSLALGPMKFGEVRGLVTVERARAKIEIKGAEAYGGTVTGDFVVNGRGGLSVGGRLKMVGLATEPLFTDLLGWDRLVSTGDFEVEYLGVGNSIAAIMSGLEGKGSLGLGAGEIRGIDIGSMLQTLEPDHVGEGQKTIFDALAGTFVIAGGVLSNSDMKMVSPYFTASGSGEIGIGRQTLDYRLRPTALAAEDGTGGVMVPLLITGTWADPRFQLDLEGIAREKMEDKAKDLEAKAKAKLEKKLEEELGVKVAPDANAGDVAVDAPQDALDDAAKKLLLEILQ